MLEYKENQSSMPIGAAETVEFEVRRPPTNASLKDKRMPDVFTKPLDTNYFFYSKSPVYHKQCNIPSLPLL